MTTFEWTYRREQAALLVAEDALTDEQIAARLRIGRRTLATWKQAQAFIERVEAHTEAFRQAILRQGIADRVERIRAYNSRWERMQATIEARAREAQARHSAGDSIAPGAEEGLLVVSVKMIGSGEAAHEIEEWAFDAPMLRELRELEKQAAIETGQWEEKSILTVTPKAYDTISPDDL